MGHTPLESGGKRAAVIGLARDSRRGHIARAALEGITLSVAILVTLAEGALGSPLRKLAVDRGPAASDLLLQAQADASGVPVWRPADLESTARGIAMMAALEAGVIPAPSAFVAGVTGPGEHRFEPKYGSGRAGSMASPLGRGSPSKPSLGFLSSC